MVDGYSCGLPSLHIEVLNQIIFELATDLRKDRWGKAYAAYREGSEGGIALCLRCSTALEITREISI